MGNLTREVHDVCHYQQWMVGAMSDWFAFQGFIYPLINDRAIGWVHLGRFMTMMMTVIMTMTTMVVMIMRSILASYVYLLLISFCLSLVMMYECICSIFGKQFHNVSM